MDKKTIIILSALVLLGGLLVFYNTKPVSNPVQDISSASDTRQKWETKTDEQSAVTVTVTPIDISPESAEWKFEVVMDTHSVELDQDMTKSAVLIDDQGKEYTPLKWDGPTGGHHREGILIFNPISPLPQSLELKIKDIGGIPERLFIWSMQ